MFLANIILTFAQVGSQQLHINLTKPNTPGPHPCIIHVHGGAWVYGSHMNVPPTYQQFVDAGIAVASVEYRLGTVAQFPSAIHDIKGAIRYLRNNSNTLELDSRRFGIAGESAGAHLSLLVGLTEGNAFFEGCIGGNQQESSSVKLIIDYYGATDLFTIQTTHMRPMVDWYSERSGLTQFMGFMIPRANWQQIYFTQLASPVTHVTANAPAIFIAHCEDDAMISVNQSYELIDKLQNVGAQCEFHIVKDSIHGWWLSPEVDQQRLKFVLNNL